LTEEGCLLPKSVQKVKGSASIPVKQATMVEKVNAIW